MKKLFAVCLLAISVFSCESDNQPDPPIQNAGNKILLLKVDYTTNAFEGGKELEFAVDTPSFTVNYQYQTPADFGGIQLYYQELETKIFDGSIHWNGLGEIYYPENLDPASAFEVVAIDNFVSCNAIENIFNPNGTEYDYTPVWSSVQSLVKVRDYLKSNPGASVKLFLYTPSVGIGNPEEWDWILILKN